MRRGESGQAIVEAAFVLPAMIFLILCAIQLTQIQQARLLTDYAAFNAARAGIVHNGDNGDSDGFSDGPMYDAAALSLAPSLGRSDSFTEVAKRVAAVKLLDAALGAFKLSRVRVYVRNPKRADFARFGKHLNGREIDFDDVRPGATDATLLEIQVRYLYELRIPFANKMIQTLWMATHVGLGGFRALEQWEGFDMTSPRAFTANGPDAVQLTRGGAAFVGYDDGTPEQVNIGALVAAGAAGRYYLPLEAYYTMRMQSNPFRKWAHP
ncbi:MAG: TadE/TadG family type IV pilus assembly protein [Myxococcales bacterium]